MWIGEGQQRAMIDFRSSSPSCVTLPSFLFLFLSHPRSLPPSLLHCHDLSIHHPSLPSHFIYLSTSTSIRLSLLKRMDWLAGQSATSEFAIFLQGVLLSLQNVLFISCMDCYLQLNVVVYFLCNNIMHFKLQSMQPYK